MVEKILVGRDWMHVVANRCTLSILEFAVLVLYIKQFVVALMHVVAKNPITPSVINVAQEKDLQLFLDVVNHKTQLAQLSLT